MQQTATAKKLDFEQIQKAVEEKQNSKKQNESLFSQPQAQKPPMITRVVEERVIHVSSSAGTAKLPNGMLKPSDIPQLSVFQGYKRTECRAFLPTLFSDIFKNIFTYFLLLVATSLAVYKVHQVQDTRAVTAQYNEMNRQNDMLYRQWLSLLSEKEALTEYSVVRKAAITKLQMAAPKTEDEIVLNIK